MPPASWVRNGHCVLDVVENESHCQNNYKKGGVLLLSLFYCMFTLSSKIWPLKVREVGRKGLMLMKSPACNFETQWMYWRHSSADSELCCLSFKDFYECLITALFRETALWIWPAFVIQISPEHVLTDTIFNPAAFKSNLSHMPELKFSRPSLLMCLYGQEWTS